MSKVFNDVSEEHAAFIRILELSSRQNRKLAVINEKLVPYHVRYPCSLTQYFYLTGIKNKILIKLSISTARNVSLTSSIFMQNAGSHWL